MIVEKGDDQHAYDVLGDANGSRIADQIARFGAQMLGTLRSRRCPIRLQLLLVILLRLLFDNPDILSTERTLGKVLSKLGRCRGHSGLEPLSDESTLGIGDGYKEIGRGLSFLRSINY